MRSHPHVDSALAAALAHLRSSSEVRYGEARFVSEKAERIRIRDGRPEQVTTARTQGIGVRVLGARAWGFACSADLSEARVVDAVKRAIAIARATGTIAVSDVVFPERDGAIGTYETPARIDPFTIPLETKLAALEAPVRALLAKGKPIRSAEAWMEWSRVHKRLVTTEGTDTRQSFTYGACGMLVVAVDDAGEAQKRSYPTWQGCEGFQGGYEALDGLDLLGNVDRLADEACALLKAPPCPEATRALILESSQVGLQIHESCGHPTELDRAMGGEISLAGGSFLQPDLLGKLRYGAPIVDLVADATTPSGFGTFGWDDEGVAAGKHPLVQAGTFVDYLSGRETAAAIGRPSTGTMRADGWNRTPLIRMVNVSLEPRRGTLEELVADTKDGVLMATDKSWSIDDLRLDFQFSCEIAWEIKNGKRTRILRDPVYSGVTPEFWGSCDAICGASEWRLWGIATCGKGDPMQSMRVAHGASPARFRDVRVGSTAGGT